MNKTQLEEQIENDSLGIVKVELQEEGSLRNGTLYKKYNANVLVKEGESQNFKNIPFTVLDEGGANEEAFLTQGQKAPKLDVARKAVDSYMSGLPNVIRYTINTVNEETRDARVLVVEDNGDGTGTEKEYLVYKNGSSPVAHVSLT